MAFQFIKTATRSMLDLVVGRGAKETSAALQVNSTTKGFLPPRMTTAQRVAIGSPVDGIVVYDTTIDCLYLYANGAWTRLTQSYRNVTTITSDTPQTESHDIVVCNAALDITYSLLASSGKRSVLVVNKAAYVVTIDADGSDTINGDGAIYLGQYDSVELLDVGSGVWLII